MSDSAAPSENRCMIEVIDLTKRYSGQTAVNGVSFSVQSGEIVGLLGPNGAGKSTILRILSCFLPATSGTVRVAGYDVFHDSGEVKKRIGYMPENNPLHMEMRVAEYLRFRGRIKGLSGTQLHAQVGSVMLKCGLSDVARKIIGRLSKGYRQRVGLADALIHEPELIILDEPTIGLDPNQIREVRQLIKSLGKKHTVLLSTHILPEVEMTCDRVVILNEGKILAADRTQSLRNRMDWPEQIVTEIAAPKEELEQLLNEMGEISDFNVAPVDGPFFRCALTPSNGADVRPQIFDAARSRGWVIRELTRQRHTLEDIFVQVIRSEKEKEEELK